MSTGAEEYERRTHFIKLVRTLPKIKALRDDKAVVAQGQLWLFDAKVRSLMDDIGVYSDMRHQYLSYARALDKTQREMDWMVDLIREHNILRDRFERRALDPAILDAIDALVIYRNANR